MRSIFQKWKKRANCVGRRDGISMAIVICIGALLLAFSLAMAYTGSLMMATANTRMEEERAYQLARSFAEVLDAQLCGTDESDFQNFAKKFIGSSVYRDYDEENVDKTVYTYTLDSSSEDALSENYGSVTVKMYKESNDADDEMTLTGETVTSDTIATAYKEEIKAQENTERNRYDLVVVVVAVYGDCEYTYKTEYKCNEQLRLKLTVTNSSGTKTRLYYTWTGENAYTICTDEICSNPYVGDGPIYYTLLADNYISRTFTPITAEKGTSTTGSTTSGDANE